LAVEERLAIGVGPRIQFAAPVYDFGKVAGGEVVKHVFALTNVGDRLLEIKEVRASCGCTTTGNWSRQVEPGRGGTIPVEFHTGNFMGPVSKQITVTSTDTNQPVVTLQIKGTIWRPIDVSPQSLVLHYLADTPTSITGAVSIVNKEAEALTLSAPTSNQRGLAAELKTTEPGKEYQLVVRTVPPLAAGNVFGKVTMKTSSPKVPTLEVPVYAIGQRAVTVAPAQVLLPPGRMTTTVTRSVSIRSAGTNALTLSDLAVNAPGVQVDVKELQAGRYYTLVLTFPAGFEVPPGQPVELSVRSDHPQYPLLKVPITQPQPPPPTVSPARVVPSAPNPATVNPPARVPASKPAALTPPPLPPVPSSGAQK
jgi:hypothetical protein